MNKNVYVYDYKYLCVCVYIDKKQLPPASYWYKLYNCILNQHDILSDGHMRWYSKSYCLLYFILNCFTLRIWIWLFNNTTAAKWTAVQFYPFCHACTIRHHVNDFFSLFHRCMSEADMPDEIRAVNIVGNTIIHFRKYFFDNLICCRKAKNVLSASPLCIAVVWPLLLSPDMKLRWR